MAPTPESENRAHAGDSPADETAEGQPVSNGELEGVIGGLAPSYLGTSVNVTTTTQSWGDPI